MAHRPRNLMKVSDVHFSLSTMCTVLSPLSKPARGPLGNSTRTCKGPFGCVAGTRLGPSVTPRLLPRQPGECARNNSEYLRIFRSGAKDARKDSAVRLASHGEPAGFPRKCKGSL